MGYGLQVLSANGSTQINTDITGRNVYQFAAGTPAAGGSGSQISTSAPSSGTWLYQPVSTGVSNSNALFFTRPTSYANSPLSAAYRGTGGLWQLGSNIAATWDWAVFVPATQVGNTPSASPVDYGLVVYDSSGNTASSNIIFNGFDAKAMRIQGSITGAGSVSVSNGWAMQQLKYSSVKAADDISGGFARLWVTSYSSSSIGQSVVQTWSTNKTNTGNPEPEPSQVFTLPNNPTTLVIQV